MTGTDQAMADGVRRKISLRLIPLLIVIYILAHLDRVNVSFAALTMNEDLGFSNAVYGLGAGLFFFGYFLFEVPANKLLERIGARRLRHGRQRRGVGGRLAAARDPVPAMGRRPQR